MREVPKNIRPSGRDEKLDPIRKEIRVSTEEIKDFKKDQLISYLIEQYPQYKDLIINMNRARRSRIKKQGRLYLDYYASREIPIDKDIFEYTDIIIKKANIATNYVIKNTLKRNVSGVDKEDMRSHAIHYVIEKSGKTIGVINEIKSERYTKEEMLNKIEATIWKTALYGVHQYLAKYIFQKTSDNTINMKSLLKDSSTNETEVEFLDRVSNEYDYIKEPSIESDLAYRLQPVINVFLEYDIDTACIMFNPLG